MNLANGVLTPAITKISPQIGSHLSAVASPASKPIRSSPAGSPIRSR